LEQISGCTVESHAKKHPHLEGSNKFYPKIIF